MEGESGEQVGDELESVISSAEWFVQGDDDHPLSVAVRHRQ